MTRFTSLVQIQYNEKTPKFLIGESLGGLIGYIFGLKNPNIFKGIIFLAPSLRENESKRIPMKAAFYLSYIAKRIPIPLPRKNESSKNPAVFENVRREPLIYNGGIRFGTMAAILTGMENCRDTWEKFEAPFLLIQGGLDNVVSVECNVDFFEKSKSVDKTMLIYENLWHNIIHEEEISEIMLKMIDWIKKRIGTENIG